MAKKKAKAATAVEESGLTLGRELFCRYITQNSDTFGNGTLSYGLAFGYKLDELSREPEYEGEGKKRKILPSQYDRACAVRATEAARLLRIPEVFDRVRVLLNELLKDVVHARLAEHIMQVDDGDLSFQGIKEYRDHMSRKGENYLLIRSAILHFLVRLIAVHRRAWGLLPIPWSHHPVVSRG